MEHNKGRGAVPLPVEKYPPGAITRRGILKATVGALGIAGLTVVGANRERIPGLGKPPEKPVVHPPEDPNQREARLQQAREKLNDIKTRDLYDPVRQQREFEYVADANDLELVDMGFWSLGRIKTRIPLIEKRQKIREQGHPDLGKLTQEQKDWAKKEGIHPEVLAVCLDVQPLAEQVINYLKPKIREDYLGREAELAETPARKFMVSPGAMAQLITIESGGDGVGFAYLGAGLAKGQYAGIYKNTGETDLAEVCEHLRQDTQLNFAVDNVQGSQKGGEASGGAIGGTQMMPDNVLAVYKLLASVPLLSGDTLKFNPFDLQSSVLGAWVKLARQLRVVLPNGKLDYQYGYNEDDKEGSDFAFKAWNEKKSEFDKIEGSDKSYREKFPYQP